MTGSYQSPSKDERDSVVARGILVIVSDFGGTCDSRFYVT